MQSWFVLSQVAPTTAPVSGGAPQTPVPGVPTASAPATSGQTATVAPGSPATQPAKDGFSPMQFVFPILIVLMLYMFLFRPKSKEAKEQKAMLSALKRGDRVMTIGGLIGSVVEVRGDEVVLKVDESNNVKERYIKSAIQKVLVDGEKAEDTKK